MARLRHLRHEYDDAQVDIPSLVKGQAQRTAYG